MTGSYDRHLEEFGNCTCGNPSDESEVLRLEYQEERTGRWKTTKEPACADCFGLL